MPQKFLRLSILFLFLAHFSWSQDPNSIDLRTVDVDALSDEQVQQFLDRVGQSGMTQDQLELVAKQRGMSSLQISKLRQRIREIQLGSSSGQATQTPQNRLREISSGP